MSPSTNRPRVVAAFGGADVTGSFRANGAPSDSTAVRLRVLEAIRKEATAIAIPDLERAVAEGTISTAQRDEFLLRLEQTEPAPGPAPELNHDQRRLAATIFEAIRAKAPSIAKPVLDEAIADGRISRDEAERITRRLSVRGVRLGRRRARRAWRPGPAAPGMA